MQSAAFTRRHPISLLLAFVGLTSILLVSLVRFAPVSDATRRTASATQSASIFKSQKRRRAEFVPGEILVRFKHNKAIQGSADLSVPNKSRTAQRIASPPETILVKVDRFAGSDLVDGLRIAHTSDTWKAIAALRSRDDVLYAEPNYILRPTTTTPNDPQFNSLYGLTKIGAPQAWDTTTGGLGVVVGIIDEGIDINHPDLQANIWTNPSPGSISGISGDLHGYDFINGSGTIPAEPHATHVAGTIGAVGNNSIGVAGVNWQVSLMSLRFINDATGSGSDGDALKAYNYAKQMRDLWTSSGGTQGANIRALNASYGGGGYSQASADAINALGQSGILFVAAAGNDGHNTDVQPNYPSDYALSNVVSVAATNSSDTLASFSNFGTRTVLLGAPGVSILSTTPNNTYSFFSGTSMATPHVTGAAALLCAANPNLSVNQLRALLSFNGDIVSALQGQSLSGRRLNVFKSLQAMNEGDTTPPGTVGAFQIAAQSGRNVSLSWNASGDDGVAGQASLYDVSFIDQTTSAVVPLTSLTPAASGAAQSINVNVPYRHTAGTFRLREFDNVGNEGTPATISASIPPNFADPYTTAGRFRLGEFDNVGDEGTPATISASIPPSFADPYTTAVNSPASLSTGGTGLGLTFDDRYLENFQLPFAFPYFGQLYNTVTISTNGNLYFSAPPKRNNGDADDVPGSVSDLAQSRMIGGMCDDLDLRTSRRSDADVYVVRPDSTRIIFRWQGVQYGNGVNGAPINFEVELKDDGTITTRYGSGNTNLHPVVGISGGEPDPY